MRRFSNRESIRLGLNLWLLLSLGSRAVAQENSTQENQATENKTDEKDKSPRSSPDKDKDQNQSVNEIIAVPNRPTFATTAESVQRGVLEVEYGMEAGDGHQNINGLIKFGIFKNLELRFLNNPFQRDDGRVGTGDSGAGFKYRIVSQKKVLPTFSVLYTASFATSNLTTGIGATGHGVDVLFSKDFGKHHFDFNEGVRFLGRPGIGGYDRNYFTTFDYGHPLLGKWGYAAEVAGFSRANASTPANMVILLTATYSPSPRLVLDIGEYTAVYGDLPRVTFFMGVTYAIADLYHRHRTSAAPSQVLSAAPSQVLSAAPSQPMNRKP